jgi:pyruvate/oxaloacetate carboxyltransferase
MQIYTKQFVHTNTSTNIFVCGYKNISGDVKKYTQWFVGETSVKSSIDCRVSISDDSNRLHIQQ